MSIHVNTGGLWREASPRVNVGGVWKNADAFARQGGVWYQTTSSGINVVIDSATVLYDFNLKTWLQGAGLWSVSRPVVINELRITARTVITQNVGQEVVDYEQRENSTLYRTVPRGYQTIVRLEGSNYCFYNTQEDPALYPAFTTGDGWPAGSSIARILVEGTIYGKGADGLGGPTTYTAICRTKTSSSITEVNSSQIFQSLLMPPISIGLRHAYPAMKLTLPVGRLEVSGGVYGGGASSATWAIEVSRGPLTAGYNGTHHPIPVENWPKKMTHKFLVDNPITTRSVSNGTTTDTTYFGFRYGTYYMGVTTSPSGTFLAGPGGSMHGGGGGQGNGKGAGPALNMQQVFAQEPVSGFGPIAGGNGTLTAAGAAAASRERYYNSDSKYGGATARDTLSPLSGGVWGEKPPLGRFMVSTAAAGAGHAPLPPSNTYNMLDEGIYRYDEPQLWTVPVYAGTKQRDLAVFRSQPGEAVLGSAFLGTPPTSPNIKGALV